MKADDYAKTETPTFVYVMGWGDKVKLGIAREPEKRLRQLQMANPGEVRLLHSRAFSTRPSASKAERALHKRFASKRLLGEWFALSPDRAIAAVEAAKDAQIHHEQWHPDMPFEVGAEGVLARWKWHRTNNHPFGQSFRRTLGDLATSLPA